MVGDPAVHDAASLEKRLEEKKRNSCSFSLLLNKMHQKMMTTVTTHSVKSMSATQGLSQQEPSVQGPSQQGQMSKRAKVLGE